MADKAAEKLDNPVWYSLSETHKGFAIQHDHVKFYHPDYCPFGGMMENSEVRSQESEVRILNVELLSYQNKNTPNPILEYSILCDNFFIVGGKPPIPRELKLKDELVCYQMVIDHEIHLAITEAIVKLGKEHTDALSRLVNLIQPGYFKRKTNLLGSYYGIFKNNQLVAVTGERMKMNGYTEVSAVVTHPDHSGKGYAKQLVAHTVHTIFKENKIPYLHVAETNIGAIKLYEKLGFQTRRKMSFWNLIK